jgi:hypothetical protein
LAGYAKNQHDAFGETYNQKLGRKRYGEAKQILIMPDGGGSNGSRRERRGSFGELFQFDGSCGLKSDMTGLEGGHGKFSRPAADPADASDYKSAVPL